MFTNTYKLQVYKHLQTLQMKMLKVEYLSNHRPELPQILKSSSGDQTKTKNALNESLILNLGDQIEMNTTFNGRRPQNIKSGISQKVQGTKSKSKPL